MYYKIIITETSATSPKIGDFSTFNQEVINCKTMEETEKELQERYNTTNFNKSPKIYIDGENGESKEVGFIKTFWNSDISHNSKKWWQQDWIEVRQVEETSILI